MKEAVRRGEPVITLHQERRKRRFATTCSICTNRIWSGAIQILEPEGVPEPRLSWVLCKSCNEALQTEMERSPVLSPLRLRIAMGLVAAERWPNAYPTKIRQYVSDRRWIVFMAVCFILAMLFHLALIVMIAPLSH